MQKLVVSSSQLMMIPGLGYISEASSLGLEPGVWPEVIVVQEGGVWFDRKEPELHDGELILYKYQTREGIDLTVGND